jgi:ribosomal subunit interface protein
VRQSLRWPIGSGRRQTDRVALRPWIDDLVSSGLGCAGATHRSNDNPFARREGQMKLPLEITFRNVSRTDAIEQRIRSKAAKLDRFFDRITGCRVVVEAPHKSHNKGNTYHVRIELSVPGDELVVNRDPQDQEHEDLQIALRDAFAAAQRRLRSYVRRRNASDSRSNMRITEALSA